MWAGGIEKEHWPEMDYLRVQNKDARNENHYQVLFIYQKVSGLLDKERSPMKISKMFQSLRLHLDYRGKEDSTCN